MDGSKVVIAAVGAVFAFLAVIGGHMAVTDWRRRKKLREAHDAIVTELAADKSLTSEQRHDMKRDRMFALMSELT
jgi:hypothetical protein